MKPAFRLDQHPRRAQPPLSDPPPGYFDRLPTRVMARVSAPAAARPAGLGWSGWLGYAPAGLRTSLVATLLLGTFAAAHWLSSGPLTSPAGPPTTTAAVSLDAVPREQLVDYLLSSEAHPDLAELGEQRVAHLRIARQYFQLSANDLTDALDAQPAEDTSLL